MKSMLILALFFKTAIISSLDLAMARWDLRSMRAFARGSCRLVLLARFPRRRANRAGPGPRARNGDMGRLPDRADRWPGNASGMGLLDRAESVGTAQRLHLPAQALSGEPGIVLQELVHAGACLHRHVRLVPAAADSRGLLDALGTVSEQARKLRLRLGGGPEC